MTSETSQDSLNIYKISVRERCTSLVERDLVLADCLETRCPGESIVSFVSLHCLTVVVTSFPRL